MSRIYFQNFSRVVYMYCRLKYHIGSSVSENKTTKFIINGLLWKCSFHELFLQQLRLNNDRLEGYLMIIKRWDPSSEFVSSSIPSWQILTAHAQPFRGARDLAFCLKVPLDSLPVWASSGGSGETARMRRLAWTFAAHISHKYQICLTRSR